MAAGIVRSDEWVTTEFRAQTEAGVRVEGTTQCRLSPEGSNAPDLNGLVSSSTGAAPCVRHAPARPSDRSERMQAFQTQFRDRDLARHPHRVELRGTPRRLTWPALCPNCGAPARERIPVRKVFVRGIGSHDRSPIRYRIESVPIPFCATCVARHEAAAPVLTPLVRARTYLQSFLIIPVVGASYMAVLMIDAAAGATLGDPVTWLGVGFVAFFALIAVGSVLGMWRQTRRYRVLPQTDVTLACDFSDDISQPFEGERRAYAIRDAVFAEAFTASNRDRAWTPAMQARSNRRQLVAAAVVIALAVGAWLWSHFGPP